MTLTAGPLILKLEAASMAARVSTVEKAEANMTARATSMVKKAVPNIGRLLLASRRRTLLRHSASANSLG